MKNELLKLDKDTLIQAREDTKYIIVVENECTLTVEFNTPGVSVEIIAPYILKSGEKVKFLTVTRHIAKNTSCITKVKGVLTQNCSSDYVGKIIIEKSAGQTSSFLEHNVLVTGDKCINNSQPILEIAADDVKASHGSTTGRVDEMQLYYLMARGLNREEAQREIISGFFTTILNDITDDTIRSDVGAWLTASL